MTADIWDPKPPQIDTGPFNRLVGARVDAWGPGIARVVFEVEEKHLNTLGIAHGGSSMTVLDFAMGMAAAYSPGTEHRRRCVTLSLNTQFLSALRPGPATVIGRQIGGGGRTLFMEAELMDLDGQVCSRAQGVFRVVKPE